MDVKELVVQLLALQDQDMPVRRDDHGVQQVDISKVSMRFYKSGPEAGKVFVELD